MPVSAAFATVIAVWATTPLAIKWSNDSLNPLAAGGLRMLLAASLAALLVHIGCRGQRLKRQHWRSYAAASLTLFPNMALVYWAALSIPSGLISVIFATAPISTGLLSWLLLGENPFTRRRMLGLTVALGGLLVIVQDQLGMGFSAALGMLAMLGSTLLFSLSNVLVQRQAARPEPLEQTLGALVYSLPGFACSWLLLDGDIPTHWSPRSLGAVTYLAVVGSLVGFFAFYYLLNHTSALVVAMVPLITPGAALWLGTTLADESISPALISGSLVTLVGLGLYQWQPRGSR